MAKRAKAQSRAAVVAEIIANLPDNLALRDACLDTLIEVVNLVASRDVGRLVVDCWDSLTRHILILREFTHQQDETGPSMASPGDAVILRAMGDLPDDMAARKARLQELLVIVCSITSPGVAESVRICAAALDQHLNLQRKFQRKLGR